MGKYRTLQDWERASITLLLHNHKEKLEKASLQTLVNVVKEQLDLEVTKTNVQSLRKALNFPPLKVYKPKVEPQEAESQDGSLEQRVRDLEVCMRQIMRYLQKSGDDIGWASIFDNLEQLGFMFNDE